MLCRAFDGCCSILKMFNPFRIVSSCSWSTPTCFAKALMAARDSLTAIFDVMGPRRTNSSLRFPTAFLNSSDEARRPDLNLSLLFFSMASQSMRHCWKAIQAGPRVCNCSCTCVYDVNGKVVVVVELLGRK